MKQKRKPCDQDNSKDLPPQVKNSKYLLDEPNHVASIMNNFQMHPKSRFLVENHVPNDRLKPHRWRMETYSSMLQQE